MADLSGLAPSTDDLVNLDKTTEQEEDEAAEEIQVPEDVRQEEHRLHDERVKEAEQQAKASAAAAKDAQLTDGRYMQLDALLEKTNMYSNFLAEQLSTLDKTGGGDAGDADADGGAGPSNGGKRRLSGRGEAGSSKGKKAARDAGAGGSAAGERSPTREMLPLMTGGELREYQLQGIKWLISLYQNGLNGILADQMGLGKTVQTIGFLSHLRFKSVSGPFMIVAPLSTLPNWVSEFKRWTPSFPAILYHGTKQERLAYRTEHMKLPVSDTFPAVCTSYEIVMADRKFLQKYNWKYIVVDEGHRLKNFDCKLIRELKAIPSANKLLLTGTPLQNNLPELWSLLHFLLPDVFNNLAQFQSWFDFSQIVGDAADPNKSKELLEEERRSRVVTKLHSILRPFLLRRIKGDVEHSIPKKKEIILWAHMTESQQQFNTALVERTLSTVLQKIAEKGSGTVVQVAQVNNVLMQLRKNCNHPDLITAPYDGSTTFPSPEELVAACGKFGLLHRLLKRLKAGGHKVLIFSQMTRMLDLMESYLDQSGLKCCRIDGSVPWQERQAHMKQFNDERYDPNGLFVFLLSTRAGGLGINLTGADTVIIYDSDWNPHQDMQAMDRCHRIGQTRPVHVYRLATANSVEGRILRRAGSKLLLEKLIITNGNFRIGEAAKKDAAASGFSANELVALLRSESDAADVPQSAEISEADLDKLLVRADLETPADGSPAPAPLLGPVGRGWEVVEDTSSHGLLSNVS